MRQLEAALLRRLVVQQVDVRVEKEQQPMPLLALEELGKVDWLTTASALPNEL